MRAGTVYPTKVSAKEFSKHVCACMKKFHINFCSCPICSLVEYNFCNFVRRRALERIAMLQKKRKEAIQAGLDPALVVDPCGQCDGKCLSGSYFELFNNPGIPRRILKILLCAAHPIPELTMPKVDPKNGMPVTGEWDRPFSIPPRECSLSECTACGYDVVAKGMPFCKDAQLHGCVQDFSTLVQDRRAQRPLRNMRKVWTAAVLLVLQRCRPQTVP